MASNKPNIIKFPDSVGRSSSDEGNFDDDSIDFEAWEVHAELLEKKDYAGLVEYCKGKVSRRPSDLHARIGLGEAYLLNGQCHDVIQDMGECHRKYPDIDEFSRLILDALYALGKTEKDYDWVQKPNILRIGHEVLDACYDYLRPKRKPRDVESLWIELMPKGYLKFSSEDLLKALIDDDRFVVEIDHHIPRFSQVRTRRIHELRTEGK